MNSETTSRFWLNFSELPKEIQQLARNKYKIWKEDPNHASLHFKPLRGHDNLWSVRVGVKYRALGFYKNPQLFIWTWIGSHEDYNNLI